MIEATVAMAAMAGLFVAFGLMRVADRDGAHGCGHGSGCSGADCDTARCGACPSASGAMQCELHDTGVSS
jgi:hypothetical protein